MFHNLSIVPKKCSFSARDKNPLKTFILCLGKCWNFWNVLKSVPIGLSIMGVLSESYFQNLEKRSNEVALTFGITPITFWG